MHWRFYYFIIFEEERQVEVYGKSLTPIKNMTLFVMCNIQDSFGRLSELFAMHMMIWINVIFLLMVGAQDTKYI